MITSDFWWFSSSQRNIYQRTNFGHHGPIRDDENPSSVNWDTDARSIDGLEHWRDKFQNTNVYRALKTTSTSPGVQGEIIGPFLVDIDNGDEDLTDALVVTRNTLHIIHNEFNVDISSSRIFFTGHKGFNLEIRPQALDILGSIDDQVISSAKILHQVTTALRRGKPWQTTNQVSDAGTVVDQIYGNRYGYALKHPYIRLHGSLNKWISSDGRTRTRMKIELTLDELHKLTATEIANRAEKLAT